MPYKDRETYLRKQREFAARRKARKQITNTFKRVNHTLTLAFSSARDISCKNPIPAVGNRLQQIKKPPVNPPPVPRAPVPDILQFLRQANAAPNAPAGSTG